MSIVRMRDVTKAYPSRSQRGAVVHAVDRVTLDIETGEIFGIIGYSGAGKSTLVRLMNALEPVTSGTVEVDGVDVTGLGESGLRRMRTDIGMIFQQFNLFGSKSIAKNVAYPMVAAGVPRAERARRVSELLDFVGLADKGRHFPDQLSGGQKQRVGIARALANSPRILLADEATSALDPETTHDVLELLQRVNRELGVTIVVITHEMEVIQTIADRVAVMENGRIIEQGDVYDVFSAPQQAASRRFVRTVVKGAPDADEVAVLRKRHGGRIITLSFDDRDRSQAEVFSRLSRAGIGFELVYGGINDIGGRAFGTLTLALTGAEREVDAVLAEIRRMTTVVEAA